MDVGEQLLYKVLTMKEKRSGAHASVPVLERLRQAACWSFLASQIRLTGEPPGLDERSLSQDTRKAAPEE